MREQPVPPAWPSIIMLVVFVVAALAQCERPEHLQRPEDACPGMRPVAIGSTLVVGCQ